MNIEEIKKIVLEKDGMRSVNSANASSSEDSITIEAVAITANCIDSHNTMFTEECLRESVGANIIFDADHERDFEHLISNSVETEMRIIDVKTLGYDGNGNAPAFCFKASFTKEDNPMMFRQYRAERVKYHSIEFDWMRSSSVLCVNTEREDDKEYKDNWDKYYPTLVNKELADERGWFKAYEKAPIVGIGAVVLGSNKLTPTLSARGYNDEEIKFVPKKKEEEQKSFFKGFI